MSTVVDIDSLRGFKKKTNFFETPDGLADRMAQLVDDIGEGARILEPSAGRGALIKAIRRAVKYQIAPVDACETEPDFRELLPAIGVNLVGSRFEDYNPGPIYNAVVMNPPFRGGLAERHTSHAWDCLKPGGRIVSLVSRMAALAIDDEFCGHVFVRDLIPRGTFPETSVETVLFLIHKPLEG